MRSKRLRATGKWFAPACMWLLASAATSAREEALDTLPAARALPAITQQLMNALPSNADVWRRYLSERAVYVGEDGEVATKAELLQGFGPFPAGLSGSIEVRNQRITDLGDVAISVFEAHEKETVYDQEIEVSYLTTHTWRRERGRWRLLAAQTMVLAKDPSPLPIGSGAFQDYVGTYELSGKRRYVVEQRADSLLGGRENRERTPLIPVGNNVFADAGSRLGILRIFVRGPDGKVQRMVERRKFADLYWIRVPVTGADGGSSK